jgi:asparagine synthase (glutamine-hydrolysing)
MCGIAGFTADAIGRRDPHGVIDAMCAAIAHRGPDDQGFRVLTGAALGMRRLSIIDVAGGMQPIANEDETIHVVFNGEIYNHRELQATLESRGHVFSTRSDTEVLVHLYEEYGERLVDRLRGMFAFAIWDARTRRLLLARDRFGIKPLYYGERPSGIVFASELRSFLASQVLSPTLDQTAIAWFLSLGYVPDPLSVFAGIRKLPPGHTLSWSAEHGVEIRRYWTPATATQSNTQDEREVLEELRRLLRDAVESHLESEVPLGAFLSGGLDSSTVVALMAASLGRRVNTFSIGFDEDSFNEAPDARFAARTFGTVHRELIVKPDADALVDEVVQCFDEPFADSSALPTFLVARLAREHVTVALSGDGGDELFGGYTRYSDALTRGELPPLTRQLARV